MVVVKLLFRVNDLFFATPLIRDNFGRGLHSQARVKAETGSVTFIVVFRHQDYYNTTVSFLERAIQEL
jgi:hypothetical protein